MLGPIRIFFRERTANPWLVLTCLVLASFAGGIGIGTLLPLLTITTGAGAAASSPIGRAIADVLAFVGLGADLLPLLLVVVAGITLKCLLTLIGMRYVAKASAGVSTNLRNRLMRSLLTAEWSFFLSHPIGAIANATSIQASVSGRAYTAAALFLANSLQALTYIGLAFVVSWKLSLLAVAIGSAIALALHFLVQMAKRAAVRETSRTRELLAFLTDALNSIKPLKAMARQDHFAQLFERKNRDLNKSLQRQIYYGEARRNLEEVLTIISLAASFFVAVRLYSYSLSEVLVIGLFLAQTMRNIGKMQDALQKALVVESPYRALRDLIAEAEAAAEHGFGTRTPSFEQGCTFEAVSFAFGDKAVLRDVSLSIPARRRTVLIGPSGGGKTTLSDLLIGLYRPAAGRILIDGIPLPDLDLKQWRRMIGYVPQELILYHDSIYANVTLGNPDLGEADVRDALEAAGASSFVDDLPEGLHTTVGEKGFKFSGGQRQRIALARALASRPKLLILDEVTSALDPKTEQDLCDRLHALGSHMAILAITHRPAFMAIADQVLVVRNGTVEPVRGDAARQPDALSGIV